MVIHSHSGVRFSKVWRFFRARKHFGALFGCFFFSGPEKCFSEHPKVSRIDSRYFRESFRVTGYDNATRAEKLILEHGLLLQFLIFQAENCNCTCKMNLHVNAVLKNGFQRRY